MEYSYFNKLQQNVISSSHFVFEPTVNVFKNGIVINHQKVGTRFIQEIASGNNRLSCSDNKQIHFNIVNNHMFGDCILKPIQYHFSKRYISAPWHDNGKSFLTEGYTEWKDDETFLESQGMDNYTDFFFNNPKDIIFIVRNPIHRFFSGVIQILAVDNKNNITIESFGKLLRENWEEIVSDIHTLNYLENYKEMIYNIKDKSKIKIVDLSHLKTQKACDFFCNLREDDVIRKIYENIDKHVDSNKEEYSKLYSLYENIDSDASIFIQYIKSEYNHYKELVNSPYFHKLN
jgi:hypothetical protein